MNGVDAVVGAARELEFELVGQRRAVHFVDQPVDDVAVRPHLVVAALFAARVADAAHGSAQRRTGTAHVEAELVELVEGLLHFLRGAALEHDVARLAVQRDQA